MQSPVTECFLDASYAIALSSQRDQYHPQALALARQLGRRRVSLVTTRAVVLEIGNALSKLRYRDAAVALLEALERDASIDIVPITKPLYDQALTLFAGQHDKEWGLTDCISFVVMRDRGIAEALTADEHFRQAGFRALLSGA